jgi:hypothetical protein
MGSWRIIVRKNIQRRGTIVNSKQDQITPFQTIQTHRIENSGVVSILRKI